MGNSVSTQTSTQVQQQVQRSPPPGCPMHKKDDQQSNISDTIDPRNMMESNLSQAPSPGQKSLLSSIREISSIPKSSFADATDSPKAQQQPPAGCPVHKEGNETPATSSQANWEYPSPQQFYNALVRKNKAAPEENIDMMVHIHNFLNERAWAEVMQWEDRWTEGKERPQLSSFKGRPNELSPKACYHLLLSRFFPNSYNSEPPFDRHDWTIHRPLSGTSHRYVIDYYSAPDDAEGNPVFSLDVRPALDSPSAVYERIVHWARIKKEAYWSSNSNTSL